MAILKTSADKRGTEPQIGSKSSNTRDLPGGEAKGNVEVSI